MARPSVFFDLPALSGKAGCAIISLYGGKGRQN